MGVGSVTSVAIDRTLIGLYRYWTTRGAYFSPSNSVRTESTGKIKVRRKAKTRISYFMVACKTGMGGAFFLLVNTLLNCD